VWVGGCAHARERGRGGGGGVRQERERESEEREDGREREKESFSFIPCQPKDPHLGRTFGMNLCVCVCDGVYAPKKNFRVSRGNHHCMSPYD